MAREVNNEWSEWLVRRMKHADLPKPTDLERASGVDQSVISRWINEGRTPQIEQLRKIAGPLDVPLLQLLVRAGHLSPEEAQVSEASVEVPTDILTAIEADMELLDEARDHLRNQYQLLRRLGPELSDRRRTTPSPRSATAPPPDRRLRPVAHGGDPAHADTIDEMAREVRRQYEEGEGEKDR